MSLCCHKDTRRDAVRRREGWNGIDYVEVSKDQYSLDVFFLGKLPPELVADRPGLHEHFRIEGGQRITDIRVLDADPLLSDDPELDDRMVLRLDKPGDYSTYTLRLVGVENIDPHYEETTFSFKMDCPSDLDCREVCACEPREFEAPEINYLAKDYAGFRQLLLDRLSLLSPAWKERNPADIGIALLELFAYEGDQLSYYQDAVATEAYLETARRRISVRRHVRLVDYFLHEGCNARALVAMETDTDVALPAGKISFITGLNRGAADPRTILEWDDLRDVPAASYEVFEPVQRSGEFTLRSAHNEIAIYTWGKRECCVERGATSAALVDHGLDLHAGDFIVFEEVRGPVTGLPADANPMHRHAVRLARVESGIDPIVRSGDDQPTAYVTVHWDEADALPFTLCVSAIGAAPGCAFVESISVARGNVILVDHGQSVGPEDLGCVPTLRTEAECLCAGMPGDTQAIPGRFTPHLQRSPLTFRVPVDGKAPAAHTLQQDPRSALPQIVLASEPAAAWEPRYDLIGSLSADPHFVVEIDNDGTAHLRFGDEHLGQRPSAGTSFAAEYRVGNGAAGNVGADSISRLVLRDLSLSGVGLRIRNPLPAAGGSDPEPMAEARLYAPHAFRRQIERAIVPEDYEELAERNTKVQRASAELVWTGSWYEADVAIDPIGGRHLDALLLPEVQRHLERYRRIGHDLHIEPAVYVPLDLALEVCAMEGYQRAHLRAALLDVFSNRTLAGGARGFFHPDSLSFGEGVRLSAIIAAAHAVPGVGSVRVKRFQRLFQPPNHELDNGILPLGTNEIALLDNDPNFPEHGRLVIDVRGGR